MLKKKLKCLCDVFSFEEIWDLHSSILAFKDRPYFPMVLIGNSNRSKVVRGGETNENVDESCTNKNDAEDFGEEPRNKV